MTTPNNLDGFSEREIQVMLFSMEGLSVMEIADLLNLSKHTIKRHKENIADKAGTKGSCQMRQFLKQAALLIEKNKPPTWGCVKSRSKKKFQKLPKLYLEICFLSN